MAGAILLTGQRTVAAGLRVMGRSDQRDFARCHEGLNRVVWSPRDAARILLALLLQYLDRGDSPLVFGIDETLEHRHGTKIRARGIYREAVRSSRHQLVKASGLRWISLMWLGQVLWAGRHWALPVLTVLAPSSRYHQQQGRRQKRISDWASQMFLPQTHHRGIVAQKSTLCGEGFMASANLPKVVKPEFVSLANHPIINEAWVHHRIIDNPEILGLGALTYLDHERPQHTGGRLDLLLKDGSDTRYAVEVQLGRLDESHLVRAIEYWDIERRRFPQYDHVAVVVAEDVTSRFLNVISLLNRTIPLIAVQLKGVKVEGHFSLIGTKVIDLMPLGTEEAEDQRQITDRAYWEQHTPKPSMDLIDQLLAMVKEIRAEAYPRYTRSYVSVTLDGSARNFLLFSSNKFGVVAAFKIPEDDYLTKWIDEVGLTLQKYDARFGSYNIRIREADLEERKDALLDLMHKAIENHLNG